MDRPTSSAIRRRAITQFITTQVITDPSGRVIPAGTTIGVGTNWPTIAIGLPPTQVWSGNGYVSVGAPGIVPHPSFCAPVDAAGSAVLKTYCAQDNAINLIYPPGGTSQVPIGIGQGTSFPYGARWGIPYVQSNADIQNMGVGGAAINWSYQGQS